MFESAGDFDTFAVGILFDVFVRARKDERKSTHRRGSVKIAHEHFMPARHTGALKKRKNFFAFFFVFIKFAEFDPCKGGI